MLTVGAAAELVLFAALLGEALWLWRSMHAAGWRFLPPPVVILIRQRRHRRNRRCGCYLIKLNGRWWPVFCCAPHLSMLMSDRLS